MSRYSRFADFATTSAEALTGAGFSFAQLGQFMSNEALQAILPDWGLVQATLKGFNAVEAMVGEDEKKLTGARPYLETSLIVAANLNLFYQSHMVSRTGVAGLVPLAFAISAGAELLIALGKLYDAVHACRADIQEAEESGYSRDTYIETAPYKVLQEKVRQSLIDVTRQLLMTIGWTVITLGNPVGWSFIAVASIMCLYKAKLAYDKCRFFAGPGSRTQGVTQQEDFSQQRQYDIMSSL